MADSRARQWLGQEDLAWNILLVARLRAVPSTSSLQDRLVELSAQHGWEEPRPGSVVEGELDDLLQLLGELRDPPRPVSLGVAPAALVVRAHHAHVDGLGLLAVLRDVAAGDLTSGASGVGERPRRSTVATMAGRLLEVLLRPPAGVAAVGTSDPTAQGDVFAARTLPTEVRGVARDHAAVTAFARSTAAPAPALAPDEEALNCADRRTTGAVRR